MIKVIGKGDSRIFVEEGEMISVVDLRTGDVSEPQKKLSFIAHAPYWERVSKEEEECARNLYNLHKKLEGTS